MCKRGQHEFGWKVACQTKKIFEGVVKVWNVTSNQNGPNITFKNEDGLLQQGIKSIGQPFIDKSGIILIHEPLCYIG